MLARVELAQENNDAYTDCRARARRDTAVNRSARHTSKSQQCAIAYRHAVGSKTILLRSMGNHVNPNVAASTLTVRNNISYLYTPACQRFSTDIVKLSCLHSSL